MSEHLIIYLDESGNLGFNFDSQKTTRYLVIALLVCLDNQANQNTIQAVKKTLRNKLPKNMQELKGRSLNLSVKKYFLKEMKKVDNWCLYVAVINKKLWMDHHNHTKSFDAKKKMLYDDVSKRIFSQIDFLDHAKRVDVVIDRSKNKDEIAKFDNAVTTEIRKRLSSKAVLTIRHASSHEQLGLQAIDMFCAGVWKKYETNDESWYVEFSDKIATTIDHKF